MTECGEVFYGLMRPGQLNGADFSVPRRCELPSGHVGYHDWDWSNKKRHPDPPPIRTTEMRRRGQVWAQIGDKWEVRVTGAVVRDEDRNPRRRP